MQNSIFIFSYRNKLAILALVLFMAVIALFVGAMHSWGNYHWARTANPFTLKLGDNLSSSWDPYLGTTSVDWNPSAALDTTIVPGTALRHRSSNIDCGPVGGTVQVCNKNYGKTGWLGLARIWVNGDHITQGTAKVNDTYFSTSKYNTPAWKKLVMCQEVAHTFGLDHQDEIFGNYNLGTCMDYTNAPAGGIVNGFDYGPSNEHPNTHDFVQLETIYAHADGSTTVGQPVSSRGNGNGVNGQETAEWGRSIRISSDGKTSLFEKDFGGGKKVFTFVIWAE